MARNELLVGANGRRGKVAATFHVVLALLQKFSRVSRRYSLILV